MKVLIIFFALLIKSEVLNTKEQQETQNYEDLMQNLDKLIEKIGFFDVKDVNSKAKDENLSQKQEFFENLIQESKLLPENEQNITTNQHTTNSTEAKAQKREISPQNDGNPLKIDENSPENIKISFHASQNQSKSIPNSSQSDTSKEIYYLWQYHRKFQSDLQTLNKTCTNSILSFWKFIRRNEDQIKRISEDLNDKFTTAIKADQNVLTQINRLDNEVVALRNNIHENLNNFQNEMRMQYKNLTAVGGSAWRKIENLERNYQGLKNGIEVMKGVVSSIEENESEIIENVTKIVNELKMEVKNQINPHIHKDLVNLTEIQQNLTILMTLVNENLKNCKCDHNSNNQLASFHGLTIFNTILSFLLIFIILFLIICSKCLKRREIKPNISNNDIFLKIGSDCIDIDYEMPNLSTFRNKNEYTEQQCHRICEIHQNNQLHGDVNDIDSDLDDEAPNNDEELCGEVTR